MASNTQQQQYGQVANYNISPGTRADKQSSALEVDNKGNLKTGIFDASGTRINPNPLNLATYDFVTMTEAPAGTETYTFKLGGSGGTVTNTVVVVYTDSTKATLSTVTKT